MTRDHLSTNRDIWNADAANWVDFAKARWVLDPPEWDTQGNTEADLNMLPADMTGMQAIELGCGTVLSEEHYLSRAELRPSPVK